MVNRLWFAVFSYFTDIGSKTSGSAERINGKTIDMKRETCGKTTDYREAEGAGGIDPSFFPSMACDLL